MKEEVTLIDLSVKYEISDQAAPERLRRSLQNIAQTTALVDR